MLKWALLLAATLLLPACSDGTDQAKELLKSRLSDKRYVEFQNLESFPGDVLCGEYRSSDPIHGTTRFRRFIVWGSMAEDRPTAQDWQIFCSADQSEALFAASGIGPAHEPEAHLEKIRSDLRMLVIALGQYLADAYFLPSTGQGLAALVTAPTLPPVPMQLKKGGYLASVPNDPWGRPYQYEISGLSGGVAQQYLLYTLGADGEPGGQGKNADIGYEHLKYLDHLAR